MNLRRLGQKGQTALEYLLLLVVSAGIAMTFFKKAGDALINNPNSFVNAYLNAYKQVLNSGQRYKRFYVPK
jgi:uncharacterized protein (UPF0333 family)